MSLQVWLPLNKEGDFKNKGLADVAVTNNGATYDANGKIGGCYEFNNKQITIPNILKSLSEFSVTLWLYRPEWIKHSSTEKYVYCDVGNYGFFLYSSSGREEFRLRIGKGSSASDISIANSNLTPGWHHITLLFQNNKSLIIIDGGTFSNYVDDPVNMSGASDTLSIGNNVAFSVKINDFRIYDHCLSPKEVKEISKGLVLHYPLNEQPINANLLTGNILYAIYLTSEGRVTNGALPTLPSPLTLLEHKGEKLTLSYELYTLGERFVAGTAQSARWGIHCSVSKSTDGTTFSSSYPFASYVNNSTATGQRVSQTWTIPTDIIACKSFGWNPNFNNKPASEGVTWYIKNMKLEWGNTATFYTTDSQVLKIYDCSGYENNGTVISGTLTTSTDTPRYDKSAEFKNKSSIKSQGFNLTGSQVTVSMWIKLMTVDTSSESNCTYFAWANSPSKGGGILLYRDKSSTSFGVTAGILTTGSSKYLGFAAENSLWYHVAVVVDSTNILLYTNGTKSATSTCDLFNLSTPLLIRIGSSANPSKNKISDVRMYATALSEEDIKELYNTSAFITDTLTLEAYNFIEETSPEIQAVGTVCSREFFEDTTTTEKVAPSEFGIYSDKIKFNQLIEI